MEGVRLYGEGYLEISRQGVAIIAQHLEAFPAQDNCARLQAEVDALLTDLMDALQVSHRNYERQSGGMPHISAPLRARN
ncbi:DUF922 domain-containing protein [Hyphobacterium sp.]|uniref:DUF922 domain-containing protein n=1 Tax=Hyphobacterium sp. TaxID=2004662 RepID=UPI003BAB4C95